MPARCAACLVLADKADLIAHDGSELHSATLVLPSPSVVRLRYVVRVPFQRRTSMSAGPSSPRRQPLPVRGGFAAPSTMWCPVRGGQHTWENVRRPPVPRKRDRTPSEAGMSLARPPRAPRGETWISAAVARVPEEWKPYLLAAS